MAGGLLTEPNRRRRLGLAALAVVACLALGSGRAAAQEGIASNEPAAFTADEVNYDDALGVVTARGHVEINQGKRILLADTVTYNLKTQVVTASGNVSLLEPTGDVLFAEYAELTDDMAEGFIRGVKVLLSDNSRMVGTTALRTAGNRTSLKNAVYSPCNLCREDPTAAPVWQIKADKIVHDKQEHIVRYKNARLEAFGLPVFFTPYFDHPDPTVQKKSGFLAPSFGNSTFQGSYFDVPYFLNFSNNHDMTITPRFSTEQTLLLGVEHRILFEDGRIITRVSGTRSDLQPNQGDRLHDVLRGDIDQEARFDFNDYFRGGWDLNRSTDKTYRSTFGFGTEDRLTSRGFVEGFRGRNYFSANSFWYQTQRVGESDDQQVIALPTIDANYVSEPGRAGGYYTFDANVWNLTRLQGRDSRRASAITAWNLPYTSPLGDVYRFRVGVQSDLYFVNDFDPNNPDNVDPTNGQNFTTGRVFPQMSLEWRYPWAGPVGDSTQIIEPIVQGVVAPGFNQNSDIPNEDSVDFEFDDTNIFQPNRFTGRDLIDTGSRVDYGLQYSFVSPGGLFSQAFVGQSWRPVTEGVFAPGSGLEDNFSDYVGRVFLQPIPELDLTYRFRANKDTLDLSRSEATLTTGIPAFRLSLNYLSIQGNQTTSNGTTTGFPDREEISLSVSSQLTSYWHGTVSATRDLIANETRDISESLFYQDECVLIGFNHTTSFTNNSEVDTNSQFTFFLTLKYLGNVAG
ncbi:LPS-assembly protein [Tistlia consotensis]|uniref:LPS-assembly protein LptD n=1 Tax=Tistlia consotensis USBA 355 TaxID=560819 RepID=A0A1Y6CQF5_9PROT|nr:LPS assembly protein LptD [Tistlia consotensis]SMF83360.1 LPS-assembly protein [Tistlia consotensis USBA 355]SNS32710.1 LPS-assembly protein [Tistlia consotensis]